MLLLLWAASSFKRRNCSRVWVSCIWKNNENEDSSEKQRRRRPTLKESSSHLFFFFFFFSSCCRVKALLLSLFLLCDWFPSSLVSFIDSVIYLVTPGSWTLCSCFFLVLFLEVRRRRNNKNEGEKKWTHEQQEGNWWTRQVHSFSCEGGCEGGRDGQGLRGTNILFPCH